MSFSHPDQPPVAPSSSEILRQRYARCESDAVTFEQMRERLEHGDRGRSSIASSFGTGSRMTRRVLAELDPVATPCGTSSPPCEGERGSAAQKNQRLAV